MTVQTHARIAGVPFLLSLVAGGFGEAYVTLDLGEVLLVLWLLVKGVDEQRWKEQASAGFLTN